MATIWQHVAKALFFWPAAWIIRLGVVLVGWADTRVGRWTIRPPMRVLCRWVLYARPFVLARSREQSVAAPEEIRRLLASQRAIAAIPCACRAGARPCRHPLHQPHDTDMCIALGPMALFQVGSGLARRLPLAEAEALFERAARSGLVHHVLYSFGLPMEVCNCCTESCGILASVRHGIGEAVRPSKFIANRNSNCNSCAGRPEKICREICPYGMEPGQPACMGCGLCAWHCPNAGIDMDSRPAV